MRENELSTVRWRKLPELNSSPVDAARRPIRSSPGREVGVSAGVIAALCAESGRLLFIPSVSLKHKPVIHTYIQPREEKEEKASSPPQHSD